jgi:hypothetical protein
VQERDRILHKFPDLIDQHVEELAMLDTVDVDKLFLVGKVRDIPGAAHLLRYYTGGGSSGGMRGGEGREKETAAVAAMAGRGGAGRGGWGEVWRQEGVNEWVPQIGVEERFPLWRGWRGVFSQWRKKENYRKSVGEVFMTSFLLGENREAAEVALTPSPLAAPFATCVRDC